MSKINSNNATTSNDSCNEPLGSQIRLRYASILIFTLNLLGAIFAFIFSTLLTRRLSTEEFGTWIMINRYLSYFIVGSVIFTYWLPRNISRGQNTSRSGLYLSLMLGIASLPFYFVLILTASSNLNQPIIPLTLTMITLIFDYLNSSLNSISSGYAPQIIGYANFVMEIGQAISGVVLVGSLYFGLTGAVIAALAGRLCLFAIYFCMNLKIVRASTFDLKIVLSWFKVSWLPLLSYIGPLIASLDVIVVRLFSGSTLPVAYYGVCQNVLTVLFFAGVVSGPLYSKIVCKKSTEDLPEAIWLTLLLFLPLLFIVFFYTEPILAVFNLNYLPAVWPLRIFTIGALFIFLSSLANTAYTGLEDADKESLSSTRLIKSAMFKSNFFVLLINTSYLLVLTAVTLIIPADVSLVVYWGLAIMGVYISTFAFFSYQTKKTFNCAFPFKFLLKNIVILSIPAIAMFVPFLLLRVAITANFYSMVLNLLPSILLALALYAGFLYALEKRFRMIIRDGLKKLRLVK